MPLSIPTLTHGDFRGFSLKKKGLPVPASWADLTKPIYKNQIVMPSPLASSTGYMFFLGWIQGFGDKAGWDYFKKLNDNLLFYASSGARPAAMVAQGEVAIGLSSAAFVKPFLKYPIPVTTVEPREGIAWDAEASALPKGSPHPENAKKFLDFCASAAVGKIAADFSGIAAADAYSTPATEFVATFGGGMNIVKRPDINGGRATGIRYGDVKVASATETALTAPFTFVGQVRKTEFMGDTVRVEFLLNDYTTVITADVSRSEAVTPELTEKALLAVTLPESAWRTWGAA